MLFNGILNVYEVEVEQPEGMPYLELSLLVGLPMPVAPGQTGVLPMGKLRAPLTDKNEIEKLADRLKELAENLPQPSNIETASSMSDVEEAAERLERIKRGDPAG